MNETIYVIFKVQFDFALEVWFSIFIYVLVLFNLFMYLFIIGAGALGGGGNSICWDRAYVARNIESTAPIHPLGKTLYRTLVC